MKFATEMQECFKYLKSRHYVTLSFTHRMVKTGAARQIGVSNYGPKTLRSAVSVVENGGGRIVTNQVETIIALFDHNSLILTSHIILYFETTSLVD